MTLRENAIEAAQSLDWVGGDEDGLRWAAASAEAASDVWEPIFLKLILAVEGLADQQAIPDDFYVEVLAEAKEALGG